MCSESSVVNKTWAEERTKAHKILERAKVYKILESFREDEGRRPNLGKVLEDGPLSGSSPQGTGNAS